MSYSFLCWLISKPSYSNIVQTQAITVIMPLAILQLLTGFSIISFKHENLNQIWIKGSAVGFMIVITSWLIFINIKNRKAQAVALSISLFALLVMIFLMTNKIA